MVKSVFISKCKEAHIRVPFMMIFDLYSDDEEIPNELIRILFEPAKPINQKMLMSEKMYNAFEEAVKDYGK